MKSKHLPDDNIQAYVLSKSADTSIVDHLQECDACRAKVEIYQRVILGIEKQSHAEFDFDLSALVLDKIKEKDAAYSKALWLVAILGTGIVLVTTFFLFGKHIANLLPSASKMASYLVITTAVVFLVFQGIEIVRKYKRQMNAVNFS